MLLAPKLLRYDRPEGRDPQVHPEVLIRRDVTKLNGGAPEVDYGNLASLFQHELLGFPADDMPVTSIYHTHVDRPKTLPGPDSYSFRIGRGLHINAYSKEGTAANRIDSYDVIERLIRRAAIYSFARANKLPKISKEEGNKLAAAMGLGGIAYGLVITGGADVAAVPGAASFGLGLNLRGGRLARFHQIIEPTVRELVPKHRDDIIFSRS